MLAIACFKDLHVAINFFLAVGKCSNCECPTPQGKESFHGDSHAFGKNIFESALQVRVAVRGFYLEGFYAYAIHYISNGWNKFFLFVFPSLSSNEISLAWWEFMFEGGEEGIQQYGCWGEPLISSAPEYAENWGAMLSGCVRILPK